MTASLPSPLLLAAVGKVEKVRKHELKHWKNGLVIITIPIDADGDLIHSLALEMVSKRELKHK